MDLAKPRIDIGMSTNNLDDVLAFRRGEAGTPFDHLLRIRRGQDQHRHYANGSVLKINAYAEPIPKGEPTGYRELLLAREGRSAPRIPRRDAGGRLNVIRPSRAGACRGRRPRPRGPRR